MGGGKGQLQNLTDLILGLTVLSKEKVTPLLKELIEKGATEKKRLEKLLQQLSEKGEEGKKELEERISELVKKVASKLGYVTREEFSSLREEINKLKEEVEKLKNK